MVHPDIYHGEIQRVIYDVNEDLKFLIQQEFDNDYKRVDGDPMIKIKSILGTPVIGGLRVNEETDKVQCQYCFWNGRSLTINPESEWIDILENETLNIYEGLHRIWEGKH